LDIDLRKGTGLGLVKIPRFGLTFADSNGLLKRYCQGGFIMYAIVQTGGKQYKVAPGDQLKVEKIPGEPGETVELSQVLAVVNEDGPVFGTPLLQDVTVTARMIRTARDRKIIVFKKKRRQGYHKKQGHRQWYSLLKVEQINQSANTNDQVGGSSVVTDSAQQI
jgi:large subunit ribosomal protein L21